LPDEQNDFLYETIVPNCRKEHACVKKIEKYISERFKSNLVASEELYLIIHIHRVLEENKQETKRKLETDGSLD